MVNKSFATTEEYVHTNSPVYVNPNATTSTTTNTANTATTNSFELSKTQAAVGEDVPFTYSVMPDRTCTISAGPGSRKLLEIPAGTAGQGTYKMDSQDVSNGIVGLEMACTNGSKKCRSISVK